MKAEAFALKSISDIGIINKALNKALIANVKGMGEKIGVIIQNEQAIRNLKQNNLIHAIFRDISDYTASTKTGKRVEPPEIKAMLKHKFLGYRTYFINGKKIHELKSTSKLSKKECAEFVTKILDWCNEFNIDIVVTTKDYDYLVNYNKKDVLYNEI